MENVPVPLLSGKQQSKYVRTAQPNEYSYIPLHQLATDLPHISSAVQPWISDPV